jgi:hypothetical protein
MMMMMAKPIVAEGCFLMLALFNITQPFSHYIALTKVLREQEYI